jgi:hypothetical protein
MTETLLKTLYHTYRHTSDFHQKGLFFSPTCMQICRPIPSYAATTREQIVQYLKDAEKGKVANQNQSSGEQLTKDRYTIRPLLPAEIEFSTPDVTEHIGHAPTELAQLAREEGWVGMRVDLWTEGLLVKVQYWWRRVSVVVGEEVEGDEGGMGWRQCLHDIMYLGKSDGTESEEGLEVME